MRILYLTAHLSDVDVAQRALEKGPQGPVTIEACPSVRDVTRGLAQAATDGIVIDLTTTQGDVGRSVREIRLVSPDAVIVALVRAGATGPGAEALLAGADETLVKHREFFLQLPALIVQAQARRRASAHRKPESMRLLVVGDVPPITAGATPVQATTAGDDWWAAPVEKTAAVRPQAIVLDDTRGATAVVGALKALRDAERFEPVVLVTDTTDADEQSAYARLAVAACVPRADAGRLADVIERTVLTAQLEDELTLLRAKEQRLRALIETIPTTVALVSPEGVVQAMNLAGLTLIGARDSAQIVGKPFTLLCDAHDANGVRAFVTQVCAGTPGLVRFSGKGLDGEARTFEFRSVPLRRDRDVSSALGVMRIVPADRLAQAPRSPAGTEIEIPLDGRVKTPPPATGDPALDALRHQLEAKQKDHDSLQARLAELEAQRAVSDAAWNAVQSQLERTLLLQAAHQDAGDDRNDTDTVARFEQELSEKDAHLLALAEERDAAAARFRNLDEAYAGAQSLLEERAAFIAQLQDTLATAESSRGALEETLAQHIARLADIEDAREHDDRRLDAALGEVKALQVRLDEAVAAREGIEREVASLRAVVETVTVERDADRTRLQTTTAELAALRQQSDAHQHDQATLADVRQQMARLQSETAELELLRGNVDDATRRAERLQQALEEALGAHTDLQQQLREKDTLGTRLRVELDQARAALESTFAERTAIKDQLAELQQRVPALEADLARAHQQHASTEQSQRDLEALRVRLATTETQAAEAAQLRADLDAWRTKYLAAEGDGEHLRAEAGTLRWKLAAVEAELARELEAAVEGAHASSQSLVALERERDDARARRDEAAAALRAAIDDTHATGLALIETMRERDAARTRSDEAAAVLRAAVDDTHATGLELLGVTRERDEARAALASAKADLQAAVDAARASHDELAKLQRDRNDAVSELARERSLVAEAQQQRVSVEATLADVSARLAGVEQDLSTARGVVGAMADERNTLKQALADLTGSREAETQAFEALRAREAQLTADLAAARAAADAMGDDTASLRTALEAARRECDALSDRATAAETARQHQRDEEQHLRDQVAQAHGQVADHRRRVGELEAEREHLRDALARADAGAQLIAGRHIADRDAVQGALDELRAAFADAEARWAAQRSELELAVAARADAHRRLSESGVIGLASTTVEGQLLRCNDTLARFCGYAQASDLLTNPDGLVLPLPVDWVGFARLLETSASPTVVESCVQHPDGRVAWLQASATLVRDGSRAPSLEWTVVDASDRFLRVRQIKQSRRLDAIRELAVSAGQEVVEQLAALSRAHESEDAALRETARRASARARDVAQQLVTFAQKQARLPQLLDVNEIVAHLRPTLRRLTGDDVTIDVAPAPGALVVSSDPAETEQWMTSLVVATRDALPAGGTLTVTTRAIDLSSAGAGSERRVTPVAQVSLIARGLGARQVSVPTTLPDLLSHRGATLRPSHDAVTNTSRVDVYLPLVRPTRAADAPFPLLRADVTVQTADPLA